MGAGMGAGGGGGQGKDPAELMGNIIGTIVGLCCSGFIILGAQKMKGLESYGLAIAASILAMLPCGGCCLIGLPFGIWALVVLCDADVKAAFR
jgi:hypothetical protein